MMHRWVVLLIAVVCFCFGSLARAQNTLNPAQYTSPSGRYTIRCVPSDSEGIGGSEVTCRLDGEQVWRAKLDFSFWEAAVTDTGAAAGYSYQWGRQGEPPAGVRSNESVLRVVVLDERGMVLARDARERKHPGVMSNPPSPFGPLAQGVTLIPEEDLAIVRIEGGWGHDIQPWWTYRLSTGERAGDVIPDQPPERERGFHKEIFAGVIPGTPLVFVHWCVYAWENREQSVSAALYVLDSKGEAVWSRNIPGEYEGLDDHWSWYYDLVEPGVVQAEVGRSSFSFCSYAEGERASYRCEQGGSGAWSVSEVAREPCAPRAAGAATPEPTPWAPELLGRVTLAEDAAAAPPFGSVTGFAVGPDGSLAVSSLTSIEPQLARLVVLDPDGSVRHDRPLGELKGPAEVAAYGDDAWLVYSTGLSGTPAGAWVFRGNDGTLTAMPDFSEGGLRTATALGDGGFVGLAGTDWLDARGLVCFDERGAVRWRADLFSPQDVTVTSDGFIIALEGIRNQLRYFSLSGNELHTLSLEKAVGWVNYPSQVYADAEGGVLFHDFNGHPPVHRIDSGGEGWAAFTPRYPDGREFRLYGAVQRGPDGSLWTSDGRSVLRLDAEGVVTQVIGEAPEAAPLRRVRALTVGSIASTSTTARCMSSSVTGRPRKCSGRRRMTSPSTPASAPSRSRRTGACSSSP